MHFHYKIIRAPPLDRNPWSKGPKFHNLQRGILLHHYCVHRTSFNIQEQRRRFKKNVCIFTTLSSEPRPYIRAPDLRVIKFTIFEETFYLNIHVTIYFAHGLNTEEKIFKVLMYFHYIIVRSQTKTHALIL